MRTILVTRHPGAVEWLRRQGYNGERVEHLTNVPAHCTVIGTLPFHLAAEVCRKGGRYYSLDIDIPPHLRGRELTLDDMSMCNARITQYIVALPTDIVCHNCDTRGKVFVCPE